MCKKAKSRLAFELRCKDRKEIKFCRLPLLGVHGVSRGSQRSLQLHSFQEYKVHFTVVRSLQDSPQAHSSSVFLFQGIKDLLENVTGWAKKGGAELAIPVCELHFPPGIPVPQTKLLLQETAKCSSRSCQFPTRTAENFARGWTIWSYNPSLSWVVFVKSMDLLTWVHISYRKNEYQCWM